MNATEKLFQFLLIVTALCLPFGVVLWLLEKADDWPWVGRLFEYLEKK